MSGPFQPRDEPREPRPEAAREPERPSAKVPNTTWIVGVVAVLFVAYVTYSTFTTDGPGSGGVVAGAQLPPFVAPLALANLKCENKDGDLEDCDANVQLAERDGIPKACDSRREGAVNSCDLVKQGPVALAFMAAPSEDCKASIDRFDALAPRFPQVQFVAVAIAGDHSELNGTIRDRGWDVPVLYDRDGAIASAYGVAICPMITFAREGGEVQGSLFGDEISEADIVRRLETIQRPPA